MQGAALTRILPTVPALREVLQLHTGMACTVDSPSLAMLLLAGPSHAGEWSAVVGVPDFGVEAAAGFGVDLDRTLLVPAPGEHWLSVAAGLVEITSVVLLKPPAEVPAAQAARFSSRLRQKDALLITWGSWPRAHLHLHEESSRWQGLGRGHGRLVGRELTFTVSSATSAPQTLTVELSDAGREATRTGTRDSLAAVPLTRAG